MRRLPTLALLVAALLAVALPQRIESQGIGGMIKKKATDAVKKKDGDKPSQAKDIAKDDTPLKSVFGECGPLTSEKVIRFLEGLREELAGQDAFKSGTQFLRPEKEVAKCRDAELMSPTYQKYMNQGFDGNNPPSTAAAIQSQMAKNTAEFTQYVDKKCGKDPSKFSKSEAFKKAHSDGAKKAGLDEKCYDAMMEPILAFCLLTPANQQAAMKNGIKVDVAGVSEDWGYTADDAKAIAPQCAELVLRIQEQGYKLGVRQ